MPIYNVRQYTGHVYVYVEAENETQALALAHAAPAEAWNWAVDEEKVSQEGTGTWIPPDLVTMATVTPKDYQAALDDLAEVVEEDEAEFDPDLDDEERTRWWLAEEDEEE